MLRLLTPFRFRYIEECRGALWHGCGLCGGAGSVRHTGHPLGQRPHRISPEKRQDPVGRVRCTATTGRSVNDDVALHGKHSKHLHRSGRSFIEATHALRLRVKSSSGCRHRVGGDAMVLGKGFDLFHKVVCKARRAEAHDDRGLGRREGWEISAGARTSLPHPHHLTIHMKRAKPPAM